MIGRDEATRAMLKALEQTTQQSEVQLLDQQIEDLRKQSADLALRRRALVQQGIKATGIIGRRVKRGVDRYVVTDVRERFGILQVFGNKMKKNGEPGSVEYEIYGNWELLDEDKPTSP